MPIDLWWFYPFNQQPIEKGKKLKDDPNGKFSKIQKSLNLEYPGRKFLKR